MFIRRPDTDRKDFLTGIKYHLPILSPVDATGVFTDEAGELAGQHIKKGNAYIMNRLETAGALLYKTDFMHSYPHCWRCKEPVIFQSNGTVVCQSRL